MKFILSGILFPPFVMISIIIWVDVGFIVSTVLFSLVTVFISGLFLQQLIAKFKEIRLYQTAIAMRSLSGIDTVPTDEIKSVRIEFIEYIPGFTRMRFLAAFSQDSRLPTSVSVHIEIDDYILRDTLHNVRQSEVIALINELEIITNSEPQIEQLDDSDMRGTLIYFRLTP